MRLVLLHGFTQTGRSWNPLRRCFPGYDVDTPDAPGHGARSHVQADLPTAAADLAGAHGAHTGDTVWVGYSMGGRLALHVALDHPDAVAGLVLVSTTAGIEDDGARGERRREDEALADEIEAGSIEQFIDRWLAGPLWATLPPDRAGVAERLANTPAGLADSLRRSGTGAQANLWPRLPELTMPVLVVTGDRDAKFTEIGDGMAQVIPRATRARIRHAGHAVPWEQPDAFADAVLHWLSASRDQFNAGQGPDQD
jgi:2-succinyl-6-hydroxy-2,4-cyclohexadiene-1-carboxylate synthase